MISSISRETKKVIFRPRAGNKSRARAGHSVGPLAVPTCLRGRNYPRGMEVLRDLRMRVQGNKRQVAFTLVELLLTVALLLVLLAAMVFNFSTLRKGASLEEGTTQLEALFRFARAHAAGTGRQVQINFEEEVGDGLSVPLGNLSVFWEPDPLTLPGVFEPLREAESYLNGIKDLISIEDVRPFGASQFVTSRPAASGSPAGPAERADQDASEPQGFAPILFYPDGSSDSAEIVLASRDGEDDRRIALQFLGVTGTFRRRILPAEVPESDGAESEVADTTGPAPSLSSGPLPANSRPRGVDSP